MSQKTTYRVTLLLGAGISIPAGMPSTEQLTQDVLFQRGAGRTTRSNYYCNLPDQFRDPSYIDHPEKIQEYLKLVKGETEAVFSGNCKPKINYEHLYEIVDQIHTAEYPETPPLTSIMFLNKLKDSMAPYLERKTSWGGNNT